MGVEFGCLIEVSPATMNKINMIEAWLKVEIENATKLPREFITKFPDGICSIKVDIFSVFKIPLRAFTGLFSLSFSIHGRRCSKTSVNALHHLATGISTTVHAEAMVKDEATGSSYSSVA